MRVVAIDVVFCIAAKFDSHSAQSKLIQVIVYVPKYCELWDVRCKLETHLLWSIDF